MWICTDVSPSRLHARDFRYVGNNQLVCADPRTREVRRFLTGPRGCEITGAFVTPDGRSLFVNVQHPGEPATESNESNDPADPRALSNWPDSVPTAGRAPRRSRSRRTTAA